MKQLNRVAAAGGALTLVLALTGCGGHDMTSGTSHATSSADAATTVSEVRNAADVEFAQQMIVHHRGAVDMAELAADRAQSPEVLALAEEIQAAQAPEIDVMSAWLQTWGEEVPEGAGMDHGAMSDHGDMGDMDMPGMMSPEQMQQLEQAEGAAFDRIFLELMTEHHRGAVEMAQVEQEAGENPAAIALAEQIETSQLEEIDRMEQLQQSL